MADLTRASSLIAQLGDSDEDAQARAVEELAAIGPAVAPLLMPLIHDDADHALTEMAWRALANIRPVPGEDPEPVIAAFYDEDRAVRRAAAYALGNLRAQEPLLAALGTEDLSLRIAIAESLAQIAAAGCDFMPVLINALRCEPWTLRSHAALTLEIIGAPAANVAIPALIHALNEDEWDRRLDIITAIQAIGNSAAPALLAALSDLRWAVRAGSASALGWVERETARGVFPNEEGPTRAVTGGVVEALTATLYDHHPVVAGAAAEALSSIGATEAAPAIPTLIDLLRDPGHPAYRAAAKALMWTGLPTAAPAVPVLVEQLQDLRPAVRCLSAYTLGGLKVPDTSDAVPALLDLLQDDARDDYIEPDGCSFTVSLTAANALAAIGASVATPALPVLGNALRSGDPLEQGAALRALALLGPLAAGIVPDLVGVLSRGSPRDWRAAEVLGNIGPAASAAVPALEDALGDWEEDVRAIAAEALGKIGQPAAAIAIPALIGLLNDAFQDVRECAAEALEKLGRIPPPTN